MKVFTDITTLSKVYPLFKEAGIEGILTGDLSKMQDVGFYSLLESLLSHGSIPQICEIITKSEHCVLSGISVPWSESNMRECALVLSDFFFSIIGMGEDSPHRQILTEALTGMSL